MLGQNEDHVSSKSKLLSATPKKVVFSGLKALKGCCFSCGVVSPSNLRCMKNIALKSDYTRLVKQALLIDLPDDVDVRVCITCIKRMEKNIAWRAECITRLESLSAEESKRKYDNVFTPSPKEAKKHQTRQTPEQTRQTPEHCYSRQPPKTHAKAVRRYLSYSGDSEEKSQGTALQKLLQELDAQLNMLCTRGDSGSVLGDLTVPARDLPSLAYEEMRKRAPLLFKVLNTAAWSTSKESSGGEHLMSMVYAMLMRQRNQRLTAYARIMTALCLRYHAGNQLLHCLHFLNITLSDRSKSHYLEAVGKESNASLVQAIREGRDVKVTVDNIDGRMIANQVRLGSGNVDYHYTHWTIYPDRFTADDLAGLSDETRVLSDPPPDMFFCSNEENNLLKYSFSIIVAKVACEEFSDLHFLRHVVPDVIPHAWMNIVDKKSDIYSQPIILEDSKYLPSCVRIMDAITEGLSEVYTAAGRGDDFKSGRVRVTVGGDQLTRCHLDSAKQLRGGVHESIQRFEHLTPVVEELFHVQQDLLEKIYNYFYNSKTARQRGTLPNIKSLLQRTNVNGTVKTTNGFEPHKDFAKLVSRMLLVELILEKLQMTSTDDPFDKPLHIKSWTRQKKLEWLLAQLQPVIDILYLEFNAPSMDNVVLQVRIGGVQQTLHIPATMRGKEITVNVANQLYAITVPRLPPKVSDTTDELFDSSMGFLRIMMDYLVLDDIVHGGDITRVPAILKRLSPTFIGLTTYMSKYAIECVNFVTKLEWVVSEREKVKVLLRAFVNAAGKQGKNKPADLQQENNIKVMKTVLRGLGAGKTKAAIVRSSTAAPAINDVAVQYQEGAGIKIPSASFDHHKKNSEEDSRLIKEELREVRPFRVQRGRTVGLVVSSWITDSVDKFKFKEFVKRNAARAVTHCAPDIEDPDLDYLDIE